MRIHRPLLVVFAASLVILAPAAHAAQATPPSASKGSSLGLPRLKANDPAPLAKAKFDDRSIDALISNGGRKQSQRGVDYVVLDGGSGWSTNLRGSPRDVVFISFCANASVGTVFDFAGAVLQVEATDDPTRANLVVVGSGGGAPDAKPRVIHCRVEAYNGLALAALPVLTLRLDPAADEWDLFLGTHLYASGVPLLDESKKNARSMTLQAGLQGAHLCSLVISDDNPLFVDANNNGIADTFEIAQQGALLSAQTSATDRKAVVKAWKDTQGPGQGLTLSGKRPAPDRALALIPPGK